jgi:hypothetical protein
VIYERLLWGIYWEEEEAQLKSCSSLEGARRKRAPAGRAPGIAGGAEGAVRTCEIHMQTSQKHSAKSRG